MLPVFAYRNEVEPIEVPLNDTNENLQPLPLGPKKPVSRSAIIYVTSALGKLPATGSLPFSAANMATSFLGRGLNYELKKRNIDVMSI